MDRVFIRLEKEEKTKGGIILADSIENPRTIGVVESIGDDGYIRNTPICFMKNAVTGKKIRPMYDEDLLMLLADKFQNMFTDENEKMKFLGQVMRDWYYNNIGLYGSLSVNHL